MKDNKRVKNSINAMIWLYTVTIVTSAMPFFIRLLIIKFWGMEYLGLNSLFASVLQILNLSELGIGSALIFSMYKPVAEGDLVATNKLLSLYAYFYKILGGDIAIVGCAIAPFITYFIKDTCPTGINIYVVFLMYLAQTVSTYIFFAYSNAAFHANQKLGIYSRNSSIVWIVCYSIQMVVIVRCHNYYLYCVFLIIGGAGVGIINVISMKRVFPWYRIHKIALSDFDKSFWQEFYKRISSMILSKARIVARTSIDTIIISSMLGLIFAAKYQNYLLVMTVPVMLLGNMLNSILPSLGNSVAVETVDSNYSVIRIIYFLNHWVATIFTSMLMCFYQPFMRLWVGEDNILTDIGVILFCTYFYARTLSNIPQMIRNASGIWWEGRYVAVIETILNIIANLVLIRIWGLEGVILATVLSIVLINIPFETYYVYKYYFKQSAKQDLIKYLVDAIITGIIVAITYFVSRMYHGGWVSTFIYYGCMCVLIPNTLLLVTYGRTNEFSELFFIMKGIFKKTNA